MLWNWNTVGSCFIARSWRITSRGMFAGSCLGVIFLVISLEFLRRLSKEYDRFLIRQHYLHLVSQSTVLDTSLRSCQDGKSVTVPSCEPTRISNAKFRPTALQQAIRALLHMLQFAVAYFVMLLAMYYNGYLIICILIGAYIGAFIFSWEVLFG
ncbi:Ctr copper transporter [Lipomyces doorenjongii]